MGYSMITTLLGHEYRYTEWVQFNTDHNWKPDFNKVVGTELYNHTVDMMENVNVVMDPKSKSVVEVLRRILHSQPYL